MALTIHTRRRIFYTLLALFFIVGGGVVFYAQGWRLDFSTWRFEKTGGIYVRAYPENASIYLDSTPTQNQAGFLSPGTLISDLLPRTYNVTLKSAGYDTWQENASVSPALVVQFKYAVLVPSDGIPVPSSSLAQTLNTIASLQPTSTSIDPFDTNQKIIASSNKISLFDVGAATTTQSIKIKGTNANIKWISSNTVGVLQNDGELYLYNVGSNIVTKLADDVQHFAATDDGLTVAALERNSLEVFSLNGDNNYYRFNLPQLASAQGVFWYKDRTHLFIVYPDHVSFLDLADSNLVNFTTIAEGTKPVYDPQANILYITNPTGKLISYQFPN